VCVCVYLYILTPRPSSRSWSSASFSARSPHQKGPPFFYILPCLSLYSYLLVYSIPTPPLKPTPPPSILPPQLVVSVVLGAISFLLSRDADQMAIKPIERCACLDRHCIYTVCVYVFICVYVHAFMCIAIDYPCSRATRTKWQSSPSRGAPI